LHGEAVAAGSVLAARLSQRMGWLSDADTVRAIDLFRHAGLPVDAPPLGAARYLELMGLDKKVEGGKLRLILLKRVGEALVTGDFSQHTLEEVLQAPSAHA
jgi:3-dehydroquinate synthase